MKIWGQLHAQKPRSGGFLGDSWRHHFARHISCIEESKQRLWGLAMCKWLHLFTDVRCNGREHFCQVSWNSDHLTSSDVTRRHFHFFAKNQVKKCWRQQKCGNMGPPKIYFLEGLDNTLPTMGKPPLHYNWFRPSGWSKFDDWGQNRFRAYPSILKPKKM